MDSDQRQATDGILLSRFTRSGDEAAFRELMQRHQRLVWGACNRILCDSQFAEDAFQLTWLTLLKHSDQIRGRDFGPWLYRVALRAATQIRRKEAKTSVELSEREMEPSEVLQDIAHREQTMILEEELDQLPEKYRVPLVMSYLQRLPRDQIADALDLSESTVKGRLERGRAVLRSRMSRRGITAGVGGLMLTELANAATPPLDIQHPTLSVALRWQKGETIPNAEEFSVPLPPKDYPMNWSWLTSQRVMASAIVVAVVVFVFRDFASLAGAQQGDAASSQSAQDRTNANRIDLTDSLSPPSLPSTSPSLPSTSPSLPSTSPSMSTQSLTQSQDVSDQPVFVSKPPVTTQQKENRFADLTIANEALANSQQTLSIANSRPNVSPLVFANVDALEQGSPQNKTVAIEPLSLEGNWSRDSLLGEVEFNVTGNKIDVQFSGGLEMPISLRAQGEFSRASDGTVYGLFHSVTPDVKAAGIEEGGLQLQMMLSGLTDLPFSMRIYTSKDSMVVKNANVGVPSAMMLTGSEDSGILEMLLYASSGLQGNYKKGR